MLTTILSGGVAIGEHIVLNPKADGSNKVDGKDDNNLAHTTALVFPNTGAFAAEFVGAATNQTDHHTKLLAILAPGVAVRPWTLISPTVDMRKFDQAVQMWTWAQFACGRAVADLVNQGVIPKDVAEGLLISLQVFIHPAADNNEAIFQCQYAATYHSVKRAMENTQTVGNMLQQRTTAVHGLCAGATPESVQKLIDEVMGKAA